MEAKLSAPAAIFAGLVFLLSSLAPAAGDDVPARLGLTADAAREAILAPLAGGTPYHPQAVQAFKALPAAARAELVRAGLNWVKAAVSSPGFLEAYRKLRESEKPAAPEPGAGADEQLKKMRADMEKGIAEMKKSMAALDAETRKAMEGAIVQMRAQLAQLESAEQKDMLGQAAAMSAAEDKKRHERELREWEQRLPADPRLLIRRRIREFLAVSANVDFSARLEPRGERMIFSRDDYEKESPEWKLCFRAGKEATAAARTFAASWLAELERD